MEKVKERALKFAYEYLNSYYEDRLQKTTSLSSLYIRRMRLMTTEVFKIMNEMCPPLLAKYRTKKVKF